MVLRRAGDIVETATVNNADAYTRMLDGFADALQNGSSFAATGEDAVRNMAVLDAAFRSWKTGQREVIR
jgi:predicted dehydrogenase